jgi:hypothetical protein
MEQFGNMGWFFGVWTQPAASIALALLLGYNLAFWVVRQSFHLHLPNSSLPNMELNMISNSWRNIAELVFLATQFGCLVYAVFFPMIFPIYKVYLTLTATNFISLALNIR